MQAHARELKATVVLRCGHRTAVGPLAHHFRAGCGVFADIERDAAAKADALFGRPGASS